MKNQVQTFPLPAARLESCRIAGGKLAMATDEVVPVQPGVIVTGADAAAFLIFSEASLSRTGTEGKLEINQTYSGGEASDYTWHVSEDGFAALVHLEYGSFPVWGAGSVSLPYLAGGSHPEARELEFPCFIKQRPRSRTNDTGGGTAEMVLVPAYRGFLPESRLQPA